MVHFKPLKARSFMVNEFVGAHGCLKIMGTVQCDCNFTVYRRGSLSAKHKVPVDGIVIGEIVFFSTYNPHLVESAVGVEVGIRVEDIVVVFLRRSLHPRITSRVERGNVVRAWLRRWMTGIQNLLHRGVGLVYGVFEQIHVEIPRKDDRLGSRNT